MDNAAFEAAINEEIQKLQDLNKQMGEISQKIGALQEEGRALHGRALEVKGAIDALAKFKVKQDEKAAEKAKGLILVDKSLVAADGKTVIADANTAPAAQATTAAETPAHLAENANEVPAAPATALEVVQ